MSLIETYLSVEIIKNDFTLITGDVDTFTGSINFSSRNTACEVYLRAAGENVEQSQVDKINRLQLDYKSHYKEIDSYILSNLKLKEHRYYTKIANSYLDFDIIEVPQETDQYDLMLICSKRFNSLIFKRTINIQVEIIDGKIHKIGRLKKQLRFDMKMNRFVLTNGVSQ